MGKDHAYHTIQKDVKEHRLQNVLLLFGKEQYLVKWSIQLILKKYIDDAFREMDLSMLDGDKVSLEKVVESCETLSMFSEKRVVCLPDFTPLAGGGSKKMGEADEKLLCEYLSKIPETCILILTAESVDKRKKLYKEIAAQGAVYEFDSLDEQTLRGFIEKRFKAAGKKASGQIVRELIENSGYFHKETAYTLFNLENDLKKIIAHSDGMEILLSDVLEIISGDAESNVFAMIDAISKDRKSEAFRLLYNLLGSDGSVFMILALLASQFELILETKELKEDGKGLAQMQSALNVHEFRIKKALSFADRYSKKRLREILRKIYQVEHHVKSGLVEQTLALEVLLAEV